MNLHFSSSCTSENLTAELSTRKRSAVQFPSLNIESSPRFESHSDGIVIYEFHILAESSS